ncbi:MAG: phytanoyl-CoA dioxygenase family protein [Anaerolineales bacterium]|nr:phytanoyl-CoA dioxygenase family protein [Anaerolineales bacterium]
MTSARDIAFYEEKGYLVVRQLFSPAEIVFFKDHYEAIRRREVAQPHPDLNDASFATADPLLTYPRIMQPHRRDEASLQWLIDARLNEVMSALLGREPYAVQTMFYFKPPGARGQALHQDQYYLRVQPGTCMAAWLAVDDCDADNGCLRVVPGSHDWPLLCLVDADTSQSFTDVTVDLPEETEIVDVVMQAGDVLFFNGQLVHGSLPNTTDDRFRRALIGHYIVGEAEQVYRWYKPVLRMDGTPIEMGESEVGGTCGVWVDGEGRPELELQAEQVNQKIFGPH